MPGLFPVRSFLVGPNSTEYRRNLSPWKVRLSLYTKITIRCSQVLDKKLPLLADIPTVLDPPMATDHPKCCGDFGIIFRLTKHVSICCLRDRVLLDFPLLIRLKISFASVVIKCAIDERLANMTSTNIKNSALWAASHLNRLRILSFEPQRWVWIF